jgi:hypothetical protein
MLSVNNMNRCATFNYSLLTLNWLGFLRFARNDTDAETNKMQNKTATLHALICQHNLWSTLNKKRLNFLSLTHRTGLDQLRNRFNARNFGNGTLNSLLDTRAQGHGRHWA